MMNPQTLVFDLICLPGVVVGALCGRWILLRISPVLFRRLVLGLAVVAALRMLLS